MIPINQPGLNGMSLVAGFLCDPRKSYSFPFKLPFFKEAHSHFSRTSCFCWHQFLGSLSLASFSVYEILKILYQVFFSQMIFRERKTHDSKKNV